MEFISQCPADTESLGEKFGRAAERGLVLALSGDLGAGKTQFVKGLARGLELFHLDLYRLETPAQILSAGIGEFLSPDGVAVIEWAERICDLRFAICDLKKVQIEIVSESERKIIYDDFGA
jgi:tRNA threonylcarbamoyladenosine biosynthesis protein TsaE